MYNTIIHASQLGSALPALLGAFREAETDMLGEGKEAVVGVRFQIPGYLACQRMIWGIEKAERKEKEKNHPDIPNTKIFKGSDG